MRIIRTITEVIDLKKEDIKILFEKRNGENISKKDWKEDLEYIITINMTLNDLLENGGNYYACHPVAEITHTTPEEEKIIKQLIEKYDTDYHENDEDK